MSEKGVHYLAYSSIRQRIEKNAVELSDASVQLQEALKLGDLRENSEYDAAKDLMSKITKERDMLSPVLSMPQIRANDSASIFEEGCVIDLKVYNMTPGPMDTRSEKFADMMKTSVPIFEGILMYGGTLPIQELLVDSALSVDTPIGKFLLGKQPGAYSIQVPGGFANIYVRKLRTAEVKFEDLHCKYREETE